MEKKYKTLFQQISDDVFSGRAGQFRKILYRRDLKVSAKFKGQDIKVEKVSDALVRFGVEYDNIKDVKFGRAIGELPSVNQGLTWGTWKKYPYFIEHNGTDYLRVALVNGNPIKSKYFMNGTEITKEQAQQYCIASEFRSSDRDLNVLTVKLDNILQIR